LGITAKRAPDVLTGIELRPVIRRGRKTLDPFRGTLLL
jgi:hypothetical protein